MSELDRLGWVVEGSYTFGDAEVAMRTTSREFGMWLDTALSKYRSTRKHRPHYSIVIGDGSGKGGRSKEQYHILYRGTIATIRTPDIRTLVRALRSELEMLFFADREDAIYADMDLV